MPTRGLRRVLLQWRALVAVLVVVVTTYIAIKHPPLLLLELISVAFLASQIFWVTRVIDVCERLSPVRSRRSRIVGLVCLTYLFMIVYSFPTTIGQGHTFRLGFERMPNIVIDAAFWWWFVGSVSGFVVVMTFGAVACFARAAVWVYYQVSRHLLRPRAGVSEAYSSSGRREFLRQAAVLVSATPFVAAGYGLLYGRVDVEVVHQRVRLARLPRNFHGFRIAQLSDIHMGPFAQTGYIRRCVAITNDLNPDLVALTGDFIAWDIAYVSKVVRTLGGLRAPHGVFGCLGNHESESETEEMIARLFTAERIHMLRQERAVVQRGDDVLSLIGIEDVRGETRTERTADLERRLKSELVTPGEVNILLAHEPASPTFDRAAELGIDLMLSGHTHGGQLALESAHRGLNLGHLVYRYTSGWYEKNGTRLYVNRGIGTTGFPIRFGARPEITIFELVAG